MALVALLAVRPFLGDTAASIVFSLAMLLVMLVALFNIQVDDLVGERAILLVQRRRNAIGWALVLAVTERVWLFVAPTSQLLVAGSVS